LKAPTDYEAVAYASKIAQYLENSRRDDEKHSIELIYDKSRPHIYIMNVFIILGVIFSTFRYHSSAIIDTEAGTLTITRGSMLCPHGGFRNKSSHVCALENLVQSRVTKSYAFKISRPRGVKREVEFVLTLHLNSVIRSQGHTSERVIEFGQPESDDASIRRICEAINYLIIEYNGSDPSTMVLGNNGFSSQSIGSNIESPLNKRLMDSSNLRSKFYTHFQFFFNNREIIPFYFLIATGSCCAVCLTKPSNCVLFP